jgi:flagellar biosynthesis/type III secretory pathway M-ring protein FliF/YscJ
VFEQSPTIDVVMSEIISVLLIIAFVVFLIFFVYAAIYTLVKMWRDRTKKAEDDENLVAQALFNLANDARDQEAIDDDYKDPEEEEGEEDDGTTVNGSYE